MKDKVKTLVVGKIVGAHGIKGELKVLPYTQSPDDFDFESVIIENTSYPVVSSRVNKGRILLALEGIEDRNRAEELRGVEIEIPREMSSPTEEDEYLIVDLLGCEVYNHDAAEKIGILKDVIQTSGEVNNFLIDLGDRQIYVPALKEYFEVNLDERKILSKIPEEYYEL